MTDVSVLIELDSVYKIWSLEMGLKFIYQLFLVTVLTPVDID